MEIEHFFHGHALNAIDAKGRLSIPSDFRDTIQARAQDGIVVLGPHASADCLVGYDRGYSAMLNREVKARSAPSSDGWNQRSIVSFGTTEKLPFDGNGRVVLSRTLRLMGQLENHALFLGDAETFQIWNPRLLLEQPGLDRRLALVVRSLMDDKGLAA